VSKTSPTPTRYLFTPTIMSIYAHTIYNLGAKQLVLERGDAPVSSPKEQKKKDRSCRFGTITRCYSGLPRRNKLLVASPPSPSTATDCHLPSYSNSKRINTQLNSKHVTCMHCHRVFYSAFVLVFSIYSTLDEVNKANSTLDRCLATTTPARMDVVPEAAASVQSFGCTKTGSS
jgi:hypothetical protein